MVVRLEPENNIDLIIREYKQSKARLPLVYVGGARYESAYSRGIFAEGDERVKCLGPVYDSAVLNGLYKNCRSYLHGHEVGGTNPSLLRAMAAGAACVPINVVFHREVLGGEGQFFTTEPGDLAGIIEALEADDGMVESLGRHALARAEGFYRWDAVAAGYAELFAKVVEARAHGIDLAKHPVENVYHPERFHAAGGATP